MVKKSWFLTYFGSFFGHFWRFWRNLGGSKNWQKWGSKKGQKWGSQKMPFSSRIAIILGSRKCQKCTFWVIFMKEKGHFWLKMKKVDFSPPESAYKKSKNAIFDFRQKSLAGPKKFRKLAILTFLTKKG